MNGRGDHRSKDITLIDILVRTPGSSPLIPSLDVLASFVFFLNNPLSHRYATSAEVGSAIFLGGALSLECYLFFYVR
jgi:hypothetical protein